MVVAVAISRLRVLKGNWLLPSAPSTHLWAKQQRGYRVSRLGTRTSDKTILAGVAYSILLEIRYDER